MVRKCYEDECEDVSSDEVVEGIQLRPGFLFPILVSHRESHDDEEDFFEVVHTRNPEFVPEKYTDDYAPREYGNEKTKQAVE